MTDLVTIQRGRDLHSQLSADHSKKAPLTAVAARDDALREFHVFMEEHGPELLDAAEQRFQLLDLLAEWYAQWADRDDMPAKMGDALHVRTVMLLTAMVKA